MDNKFAEELVELNLKHKDTSNSPTRCQWMVFHVLAELDAAKFVATGKAEVCTEAEFLKQAKELYWKAQEALQGGTPKLPSDVTNALTASVKHLLSPVEKEGA